jgi:hypothetical protein
MRMTRNDEPCRRTRRQSLALLGLAALLSVPVRVEAAHPLGFLLTPALMGQANFGTIKGRLVWGGDQIPPTKVLQEKGKADRDPEVCGKDQSILSHELEIDPKTKGVAYGFAYVLRPKGTNPEAVKDLIAKHPQVVIDQKNCDFRPHAVALHQDQALLMTSSDPKGHNVHLLGFNNGVNQAVGPNGQLELKLIAERIPFELRCDLHPWMRGRIGVFDHPFFAVTGQDGSFEIKGVPAGAQNLMVWHEKVGYVTPGAGRGMPLTVTAGDVIDAGEIKIDPAKLN